VKDHLDYGVEDPSTLFDIQEEYLLDSLDDSQSEIYDSILGSKISQDLFLGKKDICFYAFTNIEAKNLYEEGCLFIKEQQEFIQKQKTGKKHYVRDVLETM